MKKVLIKSIMLGIIAFILSAIIQNPVKANETGNVILKKSEKEFIIYYEEICNEEFEFAFSLTNNDSEEQNLNYTKSAKDQLSEDSLNVAYIDETIYDNFFKENNESYIWIRNKNDEVVIKAGKVDLKNYLEDDMVNVVNLITKQIDVDTTQKNRTNEIINGVDTTVITGKVVITEDKNSTYYYQMFKVTDENSEYAKMFNLASKINDGISGTYNQIKATKEFYDIYMKLQPQIQDSSWTKVENMEIMQPENSQNNDKYVIWLKQEDGNNITIDAKFLISTRAYEEKWEPEQIVVKETVKLPITYDSMALFIILGIIIIGIVVIVILRKKSNKQEK